MIVHDFESVVRRVHDHLYANANIRTPEELQTEVAKILRTLIAAAAKGDDRELPPRSGGVSLVGRRIPWGAEGTAELVRAAYAALDADGSAAEPLLLDDDSITAAASLLSTIDYRDHSRDFLGDALEVFRSTAAKQLGGQFFTDQRVTTLAVELLEYDPSVHDFVDICAGTGGFLIAAAKRARQVASSHAPIIGIEVDPKLAHLANRSLTQLGLGSDSVVHIADSLRSAGLWGAPHDNVTLGSHARLASNPPFGTKITIKDPAILRNYQLGHQWVKRGGGWAISARAVRARPPDILFLERNLQLAAPGSGRFAIVLPYQILSGPQLGFVREWLLCHSRLIAVIDLPDETFQPWTGTKTCLVVAERRETPLPRWIPETYPIFMAVAKHIGHDRRGRPVLDNDGSIRSDLPGISAAFSAAQRGEALNALHPDAFVVPASEITDAMDLRLNASYHLPNAGQLRKEFARTVPARGIDVVRLGDVVSRVFCPGRFKRSYVSDSTRGVMFLGGSNVSQFVLTNRKYLSRGDTHLSEMIVRSGWILVTRSGSTGIVSSVPRAWDGLAVSEHVIRIVPDARRLDAAYLEVFLRSSRGQQLLAAGVFGSVIDEITPEYVANLLIPVPQDGKALAAITQAQERATEGRNQTAQAIDDALVLLDECLGGLLGQRGESAVVLVPGDNSVG